MSCKVKGAKIKSKGKGRGMGYGDGDGPINVPRNSQYNIELKWVEGL